LKLLIHLTLLILLSSCIKTKLLKNGRSRAPLNPKLFKNRIYFEESLLEGIDTKAIYEEYTTDYYTGNNEDGFVKEKDVLARLNYKNPDKFYGVYRFYTNGCYSLFFLNRDSILTKQMFDPEYHGWRGVVYKKKNKRLGDLFTQVGQMPGQLGIQTQTISIKGDTLVIEENIGRFRHLYIKRELPSDLLEHKANW
jgi:hypothetical protein